MDHSRDNAVHPLAARNEEYRFQHRGARRRPASADALRLLRMLGVGLVVALCAGCATKFSEEVIYPHRIAALNTIPRGDVAESEIVIQIDAPVEHVWDALLTVLVQHAFISTIDTSDSRIRRLGYVDYTMLMLDEELVHVALPFNVSVRALDSESSAIQMFCRWDLVASESYRSEQAERYEALSASMLGEGYLIIARVEKQATKNDRWHWLSRGGRK